MKKVRYGFTARVFPIIIDCSKDGKRRIGIEYVGGKYVLVGREYMDEGVALFFEKLWESMEKLGTFIPSE